MFSVQIGTTPTQNSINELKIKNTIADPEPVVTKNLTFTNEDYNNSTLDCYEEYSSPFNVQYKENNTILATQRIVLVKCGSLITFCYSGFNVPLTGGYPITTGVNTIPSRFLPSILLNGTASDVTFPIVITDNNVKQIGTLTVVSDGNLRFYAGPNDTNFSAGNGGLNPSYVSWVR